MRKKISKNITNEKYFIGALTFIGTYLVKVKHWKKNDRYAK